MDIRTIKACKSFKQFKGISVGILFWVHFCSKMLKIKHTIVWKSSAVLSAFWEHAYVCGDFEHRVFILTVAVWAFLIPVGSCPFSVFVVWLGVLFLFFRQDFIYSISVLNSQFSCLCLPSSGLSILYHTRLEIMFRGIIKLHKKHQTNHFAVRYQLNHKYMNFFQNLTLCILINSFQRFSTSSQYFKNIYDFLYEDSIVIDQRISSGHHSKQDDRPESKLLVFWE